MTVIKLSALVASLVAALVAANPNNPSIHVFTGAILICSLLLVGVLPSVRKFSSGLFALLDRISLAASLKEDIDLPREARRINLLRIALGIIFLYRWVALLSLALDVQRDIYSIATALIAILAGACLTIGFFTPLATIILFLGAIYSFDSGFQASNLGTYVLMMANIPLLFFPAGTALSLDARLMTSKGALGSMLRGVYGLFGAPSMARSRVGRLLAAASYSALCLYSVLFHLNDPAWMLGYANIQAMSSFYLSQWPEFFQWLYKSYPSIAIWLSRISIYLIMVWELFFAVFLFFRFTRQYILWIGAAFIFLSTFVLQLSYLPWIEAVFFALLFWQAWGLNVGGKRSLTIFFDDRCRLCDGTMRFLSIVDLFGIVRPMGLSRSAAEVAAAGLTESEVMNDLCGRAVQAPNSLFCGYDLYLELSRRIVILTPAWPLLWIGKATGLGPLAYRVIAARRRRIFGTCSPSAITVNDFDPTHAVDLVGIAGRMIWPWSFMLVYLFLFASYFFGTLPLNSSLWLKRPFTHLLYFAPFNLGLVPINVFNKPDLAMENNFVTIEGHRAESPNDRSLLPYMDNYGRRLAWHRSDRFYFGSSLRLRRSMLNYRNYCFQDARLHSQIFSTVLELASARGYRAPYFVTYYSIPDWDYERMQDPTHKSFVPNKVCEITLAQDGTVQNRIEFAPTNIPRTD